MVVMIGGPLIVPVNRQRGVLYQPIDQKRPDTTNKRKEHPPIRSDIQGGALTANSGLVHEVCGGDDCNCMCDPIRGVPDRAETVTEKWWLSHSCGCSLIDEAERRRADGVTVAGEKKLADTLV